MSLYILDTDICSYVMKRSHPKLLKKLRTVELEQLAISVVSEAELLYGMKIANNPAIVQAAFEGFIEHVSILKWDRTAAEHYADIRADLRKRGEPIGANDLLIAAHARSLSATLVTNNIKEFAKVRKLKVENWT